MHRRFIVLRAALPIAALVLSLMVARADDFSQTPYTLTKPPGPGPFPAVVILHDCSGLGPGSSGSPWRWATRLMQDGYVTVWPDSFSVRGHPKGVCLDASPPIVTYRERAADAYAALTFLQSQPFVDPNRVAVMGGSHGGSSTLATIVDVEANRAAKPGFAAAVALYPGCAWRFGAWRAQRENRPGAPITGYSGVYKPLAPLLILTGELDDWTPAEPCRKLTEVSKAAGHPVEIKIYPGAHHSFDSAAPVRYVAERRNLLAPGGHGATTGGNQPAWDDAVIRVKEFLATQMPQQNQRKP